MKDTVTVKLKIHTVDMDRSTSIEVTQESDEREQVIVGETLAKVLNLWLPRFCVIAMAYAMLDTIQDEFFGELDEEYHKQELEDAARIYEELKTFIKRRGHTIPPIHDQEDN